MPTLNLAQLKKRAKELKSLAHEGSTAALARLGRAGVQSSPHEVKLTQAQHTIAREAGYPSWPKLHSALALDIADVTRAERTLVEAAIRGDDATVERVLEKFPDLTARSLAAACVLASADALDSIDSASANTPTGPNDWPPLLYLCSGAVDVAVDRRLDRVAIADRLFALDADPDVGHRERETVRGYRTALGAAVGIARDPALVKRLLEAGAAIDDGPTLYEGCAMWFAVREREHESLAALLAAEPPQWHVCHALAHSLRFDDLATVELLLDNGGDPNWNKTEFGFDGSSLHEAIALGVEPSIIAALIRAGAIVDLPDRDGRTALQLATCLNQTEAIDVVQQAGADASRVRSIDQWVGAAFRGERQPLDGASAFEPADHLWLCRADDTQTIRLLLDGGLDPNCRDDDGQRPLHRMAKRGNHAAIAALLDAGADPRLTDFAGEQPIDVAIAEDDTTAIDQLAVDTENQRWDDVDYVELFEQAADATVAGDLETLRRLLIEHPSLVRARSSRPHRSTLLHYLGANGVEGERQTTPPNGPAMIKCLLDAGADPDASSFAYRGGPGETTLGLLTSSGHPLTAGVMMAMVVALAEGGATLDAPTALLAHLFKHRSIGDFASPTAATLEAALSKAITFDEIDLALAILDGGISFDINATPNGDGATALHQAAINGRRTAVDALIARGADPTLRDSTFNGTPTGWAQAGGFTDLAQHLAELEAAR